MKLIQPNRDTGLKLGILHVKAEWSLTVNIDSTAVAI